MKLILLSILLPRSWRKAPQKQRSAVGALKNNRPFPKFGRPVNTAGPFFCSSRLTERGLTAIREGAYPPSISLKRPEGGAEGVRMIRTPVRFTDAARAIRAAKQTGAGDVLIQRDGSILIRVSSVVPDPEPVPSDTPELASGEDFAI
jgi:hypothetical protein